MKKSDAFFYDFTTELNQYEIFFRDYYFHHLENKLDTPIFPSELEQIQKAAIQQKIQFPLGIFSDSLTEDSFFQEGFDIAVYQHIRYLPVQLHQHNFFEIICVISGSCTNYITNSILQLTEGDICIVAPNITHGISAFSDDCIILNILLRTSTFQKAFLGILSAHDILSDFFARTLYQPDKMPYLLFPMEPDPDVYNFIGHLFDEIHRFRRYQERMVNSILNALFIILLRNHEKDIIIPPIHETVNDENLIFILRYMQENYATITLKHLANFFNYSERHLQRILKAATGRTFSENILKLRMEHAADLLLLKQLPVAQIAEELGYYDTSSFRHAFKNYYARTPSEFQKENALLFPD